jgi:thiol:disulfide interchange protein DsbA
VSSLLGRAPRRATLRLLAGMVSLGFIGPLSAQPTRARVNYEYRLIEPRPVANADRIEVIDFFWYGCPYCYQLQPALEAWIKRKPPDVDLRRIPAIFRQSWIPHARIYYTLETLGDVERLHQAVYRAHHVEHENLASAESAADWAARHGIDRARWLAIYGSPDIDRKIEQSIEATKLYAVQGTPSVVVDGRYITSTGMSETVNGVVAILEDLIQLTRERRAAK